MKPVKRSGSRNPYKRSFLKTYVPDISEARLLFKNLKTFNSPISKLACPSCKKEGHIKRLRSKTLIDKFNKIFRIKNYFCDYCTWRGKFMRSSKADFK